MAENSSSSIYGNSVSTNGIGGLMSGLDTKSLVEQLARGTQIKINRQFQAKQKLLYKQAAFRNISKKLISFSDKYFSFSSKTNILSSKFFESSNIDSSNDNISVSGDTDLVKNFKINGITSLAKKARFSSRKMSTSSSIDASFYDTEDTNVINIDANSLSRNNLAGQSMAFEVDGKRYNITIDSHFKGITHEDIKNELNAQINKIDDLKDKIHYNLDGDKLVLCDSSNTKLEEDNSLKLKVTYVSSNIHNILNINASTKDKNSVGNSESNFDLAPRKLKDTSMTLKIDDKTYNLTLDENYDNLEDVAQRLNNQINSIDDLKDKIEYKVTDGKLILEKKGTFDKSVKVSNVDKNIEDVLNIKKDSNGSAVGKADFNIGNIKTEYSLKDSILSGSGIKITYNGVNEVFKFTKEDFGNTNESEDDSKYTVENLANVLKKKMEKSFGTKNINISSTSNSLKIDVTGEGNVLKVNSVDRNLGVFLGVKSGDSNRINLNRPIAKSMGISGTKNLVVNGKNIEINCDEDSLKDVMNKINKDETLGLEVKYSSITDNLYVTTKDTGEQSKIEVSGDFCNQLFGVNSISEKGTDVEMDITLNGVSQHVTRSRNSFSLDGVNVQLSNGVKLSDPAVNGGKFDKPVTFKVNENVDDVCKKLSDFIDEYNKIIESLDKAVTEKPNKKYPPLTSAQKKEMTETEIKDWEEKAKEGMLFCNTTVYDALSDLKEAVFGVVKKAGISIDDIGITSPKGDYTGKLVLDEEKFKKAYSKDPNKVAKLFTAEEDKSAGKYEKSKGISQCIKEVLSKNVGLKGEKGFFAKEAGTKNTMSEKNNFLTDKIKEYEKTIKTMKEKMKAEKKRYWKQFSALETALAKLNSQSSWLTQQFQ